MICFIGNVNLDRLEYLGKLIRFLKKVIDTRYADV
jgi:hypothetical protein